jgi:DNA-binding FadR family transcriptional regulator
VSEPSGSVLARATLARLRERIASGEWPVGSRIPTEPELEQLLGVGRSTIREAVRALATLGMVETLTARGTYVRSAAPAAAVVLEALTAYSPAEVLGLRRALDVEAVQAAAAGVGDERLDAMQAVLDERMAAARRGDDDADSGCGPFHTAIVAAAGNRLLVDLDATLAAAMRASDLARQTTESIDPALLLDEHDKILTAIRAQDVAGAAHLMAVHTDAALRRLGHEPVVTDLTALVRAAGARPGTADRGVA